MLRRCRSIFVLLILFTTAFTVFAQVAPPPDMDAWVARTMKTFDVPGVSVAIVKDGKVILAKGYGVRKLGDPAPVDDRTLFGIASNTKAFTVAALGMLVDEGKIKWDDPVTKYLPAFKVADPYVTREMTIRDLLSHRTGLGLGAGDLMFYPNTDFTRAEVLNSAQYLKEVAGFRSKYQYNNLCFIVAGQIVAAVTGKPWSEFIKERIFGPIGMTTTEITSDGFKPGVNFAVPHSRGWRLAGELRPIAWTRDEVWAPAAGIKSNADDLAKWMMVQLNQGTLPNGKVLWKAARSNEEWSPNINIPIRDPFPALKQTKPNFLGYAMGWGVRDYEGRKIVSHTGGLTGMVSTVVLVPSEHLGIAVLTNQEEGGAFSAIYYHILDYYFNLKPTDWIDAFKAQRVNEIERANAAEKKVFDARNASSKPSLPLEKYVGEYKDPWYGLATITEQNGKLVLNLTRTSGGIADLEHFQYDTFHAIFRENTIPDAFVTFDLNPDGTIERMKMVHTSDLADFSFDYQDFNFKPVKK